jgi:hypothetical protein
MEEERTVTRYRDENWYPAATAYPYPFTAPAVSASRMFSCSTMRSRMRRTSASLFRKGAIDRGDNQH